ncbi:MAG TPA: stage II sporulation protein M, partial [Gemmatimonadaceae bacterium]|nr:stage II sporulation protein M [Gemmatimonadaceae bacterium]
LNRLVAGAHNLLYRRRTISFGEAARFMFGDVPREIRASALPILLAAAMMFGPAAIAGNAVLRDPAVAATLLPPGMLDRADDGVRRAKSGDGYIEDPQLFRPIMATSIIANNVQVAIAAFASGVTAGVLTAYLLVTNGVSFGAVFGLYGSKGIATLLLAFVAPHGVLELTAICIAGGAGFLLAAALLIPGDRTRRRALVENGRRAIRLVAGAALLLLIAGTLEGMVSPIPWWPLEWKLSVSALTAIFLYAYIRGAGAATNPATAHPAT